MRSARGCDGALGDGLPLRELRVIAGHALLLDGVLVNAGALVNGATISRIAPATLGQSFIVFHIETENHEVILAEGATAETYIDNGSRRRFGNCAECEALFGPEGRPSAELDQPRAMSPRHSVQARIAAQTGSMSAKAHAAPEVLRACHLARHVAVRCAIFRLAILVSEGGNLRGRR